MSLLINVMTFCIFPKSIRNNTLFDLASSKGLQESLVSVLQCNLDMAICCLAARDRYFLICLQVCCGKNEITVIETSPKQQPTIFNDFLLSHLSKISSDGVECRRIYWTWNLETRF